MSFVLAAARRPATQAVRRSAGSPAQQVLRTMATRPAPSGPLHMFYNVVMKRNTTYVAFIIAGALIGEGIYGKATQYIFEKANEGKLYHQIDWSKFKTEDDEEEAEEEVEAEEEPEEQDPEAGDDDISISDKSPDVAGEETTSAGEIRQKTKAQHKAAMNEDDDDTDNEAGSQAHDEETAAAEGGEKPGEGEDRKEDD